MTAVTVSKRRSNVAGAKKHRTFVLSGDNNYTLNTRMRAVDAISWNDATITKAVPSGSPGAVTITFSATGAFTDVYVLVIGN